MDNEQSWMLAANGHYSRVHPEEAAFNLHHYFMTNPSLSGRGAALADGSVVPTLTLHRDR
jgi:polyphosphate kinase